MTYRLAIAAAVAAITIAGPASADDFGTVRALIKLMGAPCGDVTGATPLPGGKGHILGKCSNGRMYVAVRSAGGYGLATVDSLTNELRPY